MTNQQLSATWRASRCVVMRSSPAIIVNTGAPLSGLMIGSRVTGTNSNACRNSLGFGIGSSQGGIEGAPEQAEQSLPVAFCGDLVVDAGAGRKHEAMLGAGIPLDAMCSAGLLQRGLQFLDIGRRRPAVGFGARKVALALDVRSHAMRRV